jgi:hypothetical protein
MTGRSKNKTRSTLATPEQHQDVDLHEEGDETGTEDHQDEQVSTVSLQKEVKDLSAKPVPDSVSDDNNSSESAVPVYSGDRLALCVGEADINLKYDPQFRHLSHQWNQEFERTLREGSKSVKPTDRHKANVSCVARTSSFCSLVLSYLPRIVIASRRRDYSFGPRRDSGSSVVSP